MDEIERYPILARRFVRGVQAVQRVHDDRTHEARRAPKLGLVEQPGQTQPFDVVHDDIGLTVANAGVQNADDVRVVEPCGNTRFLQKEPCVYRVSAQVRPQRFDREQAMKPRLAVYAAQVDGAHATVADLAHHFVATEKDPRSGTQCVVR